MKLRNGGDSFDWFFLSLVHHKLGHPDEARQWCEKAVDWYQRNKSDDRELQRFQAEAARELGLPTFAPRQSLQDFRSIQQRESPSQPPLNESRGRTRAYGSWQNQPVSLRAESRVETFRRPRGRVREMRTQPGELTRPADRVRGRISG